MNSSDAQTIIVIAALAASADKSLSDAERAGLADAAARLGVPADDATLSRALSGNADLQALADSLSDQAARVAAYDAAAAICHTDGPVNEAERAFLSSLSRSLAVPDASSDVAPALGAAAAATAPAAKPEPGASDAFILDQAMLTGACELLPHRLAGIAILPLQLRMVYSIGQRHGQQLDMGQVKDLAAVLGIGAAGHLMEGIVRGVLGGVGRTLAGGLLGGAAGVAAGVTVTFATTYALGHAAEQYYAQGRKLSTADLKALFTRFQGEANTVFPRVEGRIRQLAAGTNLNSLLAGLRL